MKKIIRLLLGCWLFFTGIQNLIAGETLGFGTMSVGASRVNIDENPIEFSLGILCNIGLGLYLIKIGLSSKKSG